MNIKEVMSRDVRTVRMVDRLDAAARIMWEHDCGVVPVVDGNQAIVGIVTDRDLCMASYTQGRSLGEIAVTSVMARSVRTCKPDDALATALATLQQHQLHRLPVVDARGVVVGMLSLSDAVRVAHGRPGTVDAAALLKTIAAIRAPRRPVAKPAAASAAPTTMGAAMGAPAAKPGALAATATAPAQVAIPAPKSAIVPNASAKGDKARDGKNKGKKG
jgi:CBS domain-containing protein